MNRETGLTNLGRSHVGFVNPPVVRGSTVVFETLEEFEASLEFDLKDGPYVYGLMSTPTERAFESALAEIDSAAGAVVVESGLAAISIVLMSGLSAGDHVLMVDTCYGPTRILCDGILQRLGVEVEYYDPHLSRDGHPPIESLFREHTRMVYMESPGSRTFEMQDVPAIASACRARGITSVVDNTWATPLGFRPIEHGVDIVIHALTKYVGGHSDLMLGGITTCDRDNWDRVKQTAVELGHGCSPDDAWLGLRGLRSLAARLDRHEHSGFEIARWLQQQPAVKRIMHPGLPGDPGHEIWSRDFDRATGLFGAVLHPVDQESFRRMVDGLELFRLGYSWGGFESLLIPLDSSRGVRTASTWDEEGLVIRISAGLEDPADLIADLSAGLERLQTP
ncbi:MAG: cystathionine beta-lyase [Phycisphaerales bacterium]|nr:cystathionine beta-lyase [Phycisphaerales bacterium]